MRVITNINDFKLDRGSCVAIGVFDGMHKAHRLIISSALKMARGMRVAAVVLTFWPHPQGKPSLNSLSRRLRMIEELGVDVCVVIRFDRKFAGVSRDDFVKNILVGRLNARAVFIGNNFRFGKNQKGDVRFLEKASREYGFIVKAFKVLKIGNADISSTLIRGLISAGKLKQAEKILTRPVSILGTVIEGESLAAKLGFPTANIEAHHEILPPPGIYSVRIILDKKEYPGVCYIGSSPTFFGKNKKQSIEAHIFNFKKNIYGRDLEIQFIRKIRDESRFSSPQNLVKQVKKDIIKAKSFFLNH